MVVKLIIDGALRDPAVHGVSSYSSKDLPAQHVRKMHSNSKNLETCTVVSGTVDTCKIEEKYF